MAHLQGKIVKIWVNRRRLRRQQQERRQRQLQEEQECAREREREIEMELERRLDAQTGDTDIEDELNGSLELAGERSEVIHDHNQNDELEASGIKLEEPEEVVGRREDLESSDLSDFDMSLA